MLNEACIWWLGDINVDVLNVVIDFYERLTIFIYIITIFSFIFYLNLQLYFSALFSKLTNYPCLRFLFILNIDGPLSEITVELN